MRDGITDIDQEPTIMMKLLSTILNWMEHSETRELEKYLAQSASPADLERRMREWEHKHNSFNYVP